MALQPIKGAVNRRFRPSSYRRNDEVAKETISTYLEANGHTILDSKENFSLTSRVRRMVTSTTVR